MKTEEQDLQAKAVRPLFKVLKRCRMCRSVDLVEYLDLGCTPPADQFRKKEELYLPEISYPLIVLLCKTCGLSQLSHVVDKRVLYQYDYPYEQSTTKTGKKHWDEFAQTSIADIGLAPGSLVVDLGSNVGTLLSSFRDLGMRIFGVDPAPNIVRIANKENKVPTICDFFGMNSVRTINKKAGKADLILGSNVFAHIDDLDEVMRASKFLLNNNGVFIFESPYFMHLVDSMEYDTIYHEHLSYLSVRPLIGFFKRFGMEVFLIKQTDIHGGSFRVFVGRKGLRKIDPSVSHFINAEKKSRLHDISTMKRFAYRVERHREELVGLVESLILKGKKVAGVSAPAKGMTLVNYCGFTRRQIPFISEKARLKIGRYTPGGRIPIVSDKELIRRRPDYAILLAWNFSPEIIKNMKEFSKQGGKFIIPVPKPKIV